MTVTVLLTVAPAAGAVTETLRRLVGRNDGRHLRRSTADVAGRVLGRDAVVVGAGRKPRIRVARARRLRDPVPGRRREASGLRAVHVVAETPTLSLDAVQPSVADPIAVDADRPDGADGGDVSGGGGEPLTAVCMSCCTSPALSARL